MGMGSTVVAAHCSQTRFTIYWVGDSRAYLWRWNNELQRWGLQQVSKDHSVVQLMVDRGEISSREMREHPDRHIITQCVGSFEQDTLDVGQYSDTWQAGDKLLLCSDGLSDELTDQLIGETLEQQSELPQLMNTLLNRALSGGGRDNITIQIIESPMKLNTEQWPDAPCVNFN